MRSLVAMASSALALCLAMDASAYCLRYSSGNTHFSSWKTFPVTYRVSDTLTDAKLLAAIDAAFATWGGVSCSKLKFTKGEAFKQCLVEPCDTGTVKFEHGTPYIFVFWVTTTWDKLAATSATSYFTQDNAGTLTSGSIAINAKDYQFSDSVASGCLGVFDLQSFMMPLIGGVVGLGSSDFKPSVMDGVPVAYCSTDKRTLTDDDKNALYYFYTDGSCPKPPVPNPVSGCAGGPGGPTTPGPEGARREVGPPLDGSASGHEAASPPPGNGGGGGCCRVGHSGTESAGLPTGLLVLALLALGLRCRRPR